MIRNLKRLMFVTAACALAAITLTGCPAEEQAEEEIGPESAGKPSSDAAWVMPSDAPLDAILT